MVRNSGRYYKIGSAEQYFTHNGFLQWHAKYSTGNCRVTINGRLLLGLIHLLDINSKTRGVPIALLTM